MAATTGGMGESQAARSPYQRQTANFGSRGVVAGRAAAAQLLAKDDAVMAHEGATGIGLSWCFRRGRRGSPGRRGGAAATVAGRANAHSERGGDAATSA